MCIKHFYCYKQENAIVPSRKWSRNTGGLQTMDWGSFLHWVSGTGESTWLQRENWFDYGLIYRATLQLRAQLWAILAVASMEKTWGVDSPKFSHLLSEQLHPPSRSSSRSLISHTIDWNPKRQDWAGCNPAFLWIVDWMWWRCGVLFL